MIVQNPKKANYVIRFVYLLLLTGYIMCWLGSYHAVGPLKTYNDLAIKYVADTASGKSLSPEKYKEFESILTRDEQERVDYIKEQVQNTFETEDRAVLENELLLGKDLTETNLYENIKKDLDSKPSLLTKESMQNIADMEEGRPFVDKYMTLLSSNKLIQGILLFLTFPAFSPLILAIVVKIMVTRIYIKSKKEIPNEVYMEKIPSIYTTNLILAIFSIMAFFTEPVIGIIFAIYSHLLFIYQLYLGLRLKPIEIKTGKNKPAKSVKGRK